MTLYTALCDQKMLPCTDLTLITPLLRRKRIANDTVTCPLFLRLMFVRHHSMRRSECSCNIGKWSCRNDEPKCLGKGTQGSIAYEACDLGALAGIVENPSGGPAN
jgi:hypothetical protein